MEASAQHRPRSAWSPVSLALIALMAIGSVGARSFWRRRRTSGGR